jgi:hypothetical protein
MKFDPDEFMRKVFEDVEQVSPDKAERMATGLGETACRNRCAMYGSIRKNFISELGVLATDVGKLVVIHDLPVEYAKTGCRNAFARNSHHAATNIKQALIDKTINEALAEGMRQQRNGGNDRGIGKVASKADGIKAEPKRRTPIVWREMRGSSPAPSFHNAKAGIMGMGITICHDIFHDSTIIGLEGDSIKHDIRPLIGELSDPALLRLRDLFSNTHGFDVGDNNIYSAVKALAFENCFNPVADMIVSAQAGWDKQPRLDKMATAYLSAEDTELNRIVIRKHMIAAVRRVRQPGCQYQIMVVLESDEGWNKSAAIRTIAGPENFSDENILAARGKEAMELLHSIWHHECAELTDIRKADVEHVKAFISRQWDMHRPAYGRVLVKQPRQSVEWGTTNDSEYLTSQTGNRRFAPMRLVRPIDIEKLKKDRLQLIGESAHYETQGEDLVIPETMWPLARAEQEKRRIADPWEDILANIPDNITGADAARHTLIHRTPDGRDQIATSDIMTHLLKIPAVQQSGAMGRRIILAMERNGWQRHDSGLIKISGRNARGYWRNSIPST